MYHHTGDPGENLMGEGLKGGLEEKTPSLRSSPGAGYLHKGMLDFSSPFGCTDSNSLVLDVKGSIPRVSVPVAIYLT